MSGEKYPFLEISRNEVDLLFSTPLQQQARIGYLRGDFGRGTEFWTTWWDQHEEFKSQDFKDELDDLVNTLRKDGPLKDLSAMQKFCWDHPQARMSPEASSRSYAFRIDTEQHRYYLRCIPERGDYNFYLHCYRTEEFEKDAPHPSIGRHGNAEKKKQKRRRAVMPQYDLSSIGALTAAAELAHTRADQEPSQDSYNAAWLHGYASALADAARQLEPQQELIDAITGYMGKQYDSAELYTVLHDTLTMSDGKIKSLGFDLPQCAESKPETHDHNTQRREPSHAR